MTRRKTREISKLWKGLLLLFLTISNARSDIPVALTQADINATLGPVDIPSGNNTDLRKTYEAVDSLPPTALNNDVVRSKLPLYSSTTPSIERAAIRILKPSSYGEKNLQRNQDLTKTIKPMKIEKDEDNSKKKQLEKLIENDKKIELMEKDESDDLEEHKKFKEHEPTIISLINDTFVNRGMEIQPDVNLANTTKDVELFRNSTVPKIMKLVELEEFGKRNETKNQTTKSSIVVDDHLNKRIDDFNVENGNETPLKLKVESSIEKSSNLTPKARTITDWSHSGINQFSSSDEKIISLTKHEKPYPYNRSESTDEIVLENTIGRNQEHIKSIITEPTVVIDNNIQQSKPSHYKRSGNNNSSWLITDPTLTTNRDDNISTSPSTLNLLLTKKLNDVPDDNLEDVILTHSRADAIENGLTQAPEYNKTIINVDSDITDTYLSQSTTEVNVDIQREMEKSKIIISPVNITEPLTKISTIESTTRQFDLTTSATTSTTSQAISSSLPTSNFAVNSSGRAIDSSTSSSVEYEFIGLTVTTENNSDDGNTVTNTHKNLTPTTSSINLSTTPTIFLTTIADIVTTENSTESTTMDNIDTSTTDFSISDDTIATTDETWPDTTFNTTIIDTSIPEATTSFMEITTVTLSADTESTNDFNQSSTPLVSLPTTSVPFIVESGGQSTASSSVSTTDTTAVTNFEENTTTIEGVTEIIRIAPEDVTLLVKIVVDGTWSEICPSLPNLRQLLADLLTSGTDKIVMVNQIIFQKNACTKRVTRNTAAEITMSTIFLYVVDSNGKFDETMTKILPSLYTRSPVKFNFKIHSFQLVQDSDSRNTIAVIIVSSVAFICLILLASLLFIMRKRQTRFNYGERCRPVSLDAYSLDSVSAYNSVRRKGAMRASKRSYGNPTFEDSSATPSHPLNFSGLSLFCNELNAIAEEFTSIPQVSARIDELPPGAEIKNRYANVVPLPETRVGLNKINNDPLTEYINASYVRGPKNATKYYIACQGPIESTVTDFWRMIWEQQTKVIIMLTDLIENGVEKCAEYIPPSEVTDCHRLYGDLQVTLKKRETKEKYAISTLNLKNLENNTYREISHIWYLWPANGVQTDAAGLIAILLEARALQRGGPGPIVVHCSPGTGRTGTLIALDLGIRQYEITRTVDVPRVVYTIRRDRAGAVQTKEQYGFIYKALNLYATKLAGGGLEST